MKKVLMIGLTPPLEGGSERHIYEISSRIKNSRVLTQKGSICKNKIEIPIPKKASMVRNLIFAFLVKIYSFYLLIKPKREYGVIHIHENLLYFLAPLLRLRYDVIITVHGIEGFKFYDNKFLWFFFKNSLRFANKIISVSVADERKLKKEFDNVVYVPNGVDLSVYGGIRKKKVKKITFMGRIHEQKGVRHLLKAFEKFNEEFEDYKLEIIGDNKGDYATDLREDYDKNIIWKGFILDRKKLFSELASSSIIVYPSMWEALPWPALLEGLASGNPVIASDLEGMREIFKDGKEILLSKVGDLNSIYEDMRKLAKNEGLAKRIGEKGKKKAREFSWNSIATKIDKIYNQIKS